MIELLKRKKVIFFDVGYTLDYPSSGDWIFTEKFYEVAGKRAAPYTLEEMQRASEVPLEYLDKNHLVMSVEEQYGQYVYLYSEISKNLALGLTQEEVNAIAYDQTYNVENVKAYPDAKHVLDVLSKSFKLGVISDTWPSLDMRLQAMGIREYLSFFTYSCFLGTFKPDRRMYEDALSKCGCRAEETVFIDDSVKNLDGAARLGITPILIAANPASDIETQYMKIHNLSELIR